MAGERVGTTSGAVNFRDGPGFTFNIMSVLPPGVQVSILGEQGDWFEVAVGGQHGFLNHAYVHEWLKDQADLQAAALAPGDPKLDAGVAAQRMLADIWNSYGGLLGRLAAQISIDPAVAVAVCATEAGGDGFGPDGRMIIRFENHIFWSQWGKSHPDQFNARFKFDPDAQWQGHQYRPAPDADWQRSHASQASEWDALRVAQEMDAEAARKSISMGLPQIMGFNYASIGYPSVDDMFDRFSADVRNQLLALFDFIHSHAALTQALQQGDFLAFARGYNGGGQAETYNNILGNYMSLFATLPDATAGGVRGLGGRVIFPEALPLIERVGAAGGAPGG